MAADMDLELFRASFARVSDAYGIETPGGPKAIRSPLVDEILRDHLDGKTRIGAYTIDAEGLADQIIIDVDIPKGKENDPAEWERARESAKAVLAVFADLGIEAFVTTSKSRGYHVRSLWEPSPAAILRQVGEYITKRAGVVAEVFPKQDRRAADGLGNFVWLPLHGKSLKAGKTAILDDENGLDPMPDQWETLRDIRRNSHETLANGLAIVEEGEPAPKKDKAPTVGDIIPELERNNTLASLAGTMRRRGFSPQSIEAALIVENQAKCTPPLHDGEVRKIAASISRYEPAANVATTGPKAGVPLSVRDSAETFQLKRSLKRSANDYQTLLDKACLTEDEKTDATPVAAPNKKPEINVANQNLSVLTKATWNAVAKANKPEYLFLLGDSAVRIEPNPNEEDFSALKSLNIDRLRGEAARAADFVAFKKKKNGVVVKVSALPPVPVIHDMLALPQAKIPLPPLSGVIHAPAFGKDGTLHVAPGYNPTTRSYYAPAKGFRVLRVSESPAELEIDLAKTLILDELLCDFPFTDEADLAHAVALFLLLFARSLIEGPTPLHLIDKPTQGTGATLLADVLTFPALGRSIAAMSEGDDEDEWRRRITAILGGGTTAVLFDNLRRPLDSGAVASAVTATSWEDRKIGTSNNVHLPVQCAWIITANNAVLSGEITRRTVLIRLDAKEVQPWLRSGFRHSDLRGWARENRAKLVWAALTLIQAWLASGRPIPRDLPSFGMFEKWASILGGVLHHVGIPGFLNNRSTLYNSSDSEGAEIRRFLNAWWAMHKDSDVGVAALWKIASSPKSSLPLGDKGERSQKTRFGILLSKLRDQRYQLTEGLTVCVKTAGTMNNAAQWKLTCAV